MVDTISDEDLVEGTLGGNEDAFSRLYERYRHRVYATAYRIVQDAAEAQDATQEIFVKLYRSLSSWNARRSRFSTWLYRLAANHAIDCWRGRRRRSESQLEPEPEDRALREYQLTHAIRSPYRDVENKESIEEIRQFVGGLPDLQKKVFVLRYFQECKLEEIAEMENCSLGTVKTSLFRATQAVRRGLRKAGSRR